MSLDLYTRNIPLTQKARFWGNYVSALKGNTSHHMSKMSIMRTSFRKCWSLRRAWGQGDQLLPQHHWDHSPHLPRPEERVRKAGDPHVEPDQEQGPPHPLSARGQWQVTWHLCRHLTIFIDAKNTFKTCLFLFRINTLGYNYCPVHTEIYGSYRNQAVRGTF